MLTVHPDDRISTEAILGHFWVTSHCNSGANSAAASCSGGNAENNAVSVKSSALDNAAENSFSRYALGNALFSVNNALIAALRGVTSANRPKRSKLLVPS